MSTHATYDIERDQIMTMIRDPNFISRFPPLRQLSRKLVTVEKSCCGGARSKGSITAADIENAKRALTGMDAASKLELRRLLDADQVRITYSRTNGAGKVIFRF